MGAQEISWDWQPLVSVGPIKFGELAEPAIQKFSLQKQEKPFESFDSDTYEFPNCETRIYVDENQKIEDVGCSDNIYYQGENLFGLTLDEIRLRFGKEDKIGETLYFEFEDGDFEEIPVEFEKLGLQLWLRDGVVVSAMVFGSYDDERD
jgi:hypothetical protein